MSKHASCRIALKGLRTRDRDIRWMLRQNLGKARLARMDSAWVKRFLAVLDAGPEGDARG